MFACLFSDGHVELLSAPHEDAIDFFEFSLSDLPKPESDSPHNLYVNFETHTFVLIADSENEGEDQSYKDDYDEFVAGLMEGYQNE